MRARFIHSNNALVLVAALSAVALLGSCAGGDGDGSDSVTVQGDVALAYVKRPIDPAEREVAGNPTDSISSHPGSDLYVRVRSSPSATECPITRSHTQNTDTERRGDVSDPEVSADGNKILFSMRGPGDETWDIWEADVSAIVRTGTCSAAPLRRLINDNGKARNNPNITWGDDLDPAYLADGRIVFASNRQEKTYRTLGRKYIDEYEREPTVVLHTMDVNGGNIQQISFNMSHDRNPTVLQSGEIMFSHWDHVGNRNQFTIFKTNADGTGMFVLYGAHSGVNSYLHPREMPDGRLMSDGMPLQGTNEGGPLFIIDVKNFAESNQPAPLAAAGALAQFQPSVRQIDPGRMASDNGRFTTPFPLWDNTNRALVTFTPGGRTEPVMQANPLTGVQEQVVEEKTPAYGIYMMDLSTGALRGVALPRVNANGDPIEMIVDPIPLMARSGAGGGTTGIIPIETVTDSAMATRGVGRLTVKSIYDTDSENRMNNSVLTAWERQSRTANADSIVIVTKANDAVCNAVDSRPRYPNCDTRSQVADILRLKDPVQTPADNRAGRFVRIARAVPTVSGISMETIGETEFEMQQILGYVPVEPDGSFTVEVPADTPIALSVTDAYGRAFQTHTSWLNVRPGETVTCKGCHSPRRSSPNSLNQLPITAGNPNSALQNTSGVLVPNGNPIAGETMVETRLRVTPTALVRSLDVEYVDIWTYQDSQGNALPKSSAISIRYNGSTFRGTTVAQGVPVVPGTVNVDGYTNQPAIVINYQQHIQPILTAKCVSCHNGSQVPDLSATVSGTGRATSYESLLVGAPVLNPDGTPQLRTRDGEVEVVREDAYVEPGLARGTQLLDKIFPQGMRDPASFAADAHATYLNLSEKRLITEWIDIGAQYYNDPCITRNANGSCATFRAVSGLSESVFASTVQPLLLQQCAGCHVATGRTPNDPPFQAKRLVLTGSEGDFNVTLSMVSDVCSSATSALLRYPTSNRLSNPPVLTDPVHPHIFDAGPGPYQTIQTWINAGC